MLLHYVSISRTYLLGGGGGGPRISVGSNELRCEKTGICTISVAKTKLCSYCTADLSLLFLHRQKSGFLETAQMICFIQISRNLKLLH